MGNQEHFKALHLHFKADTLQNIVVLTKHDQWEGGHSRQNSLAFAGCAGRSELIGSCMRMEFIALRNQQY